MTLVFDGTYAIGEAHGTWTHAPDAAPIATNQGNLMNQVYRPDSWAFAITSTMPDVLPAMTFDTTNSVAELCIGLCKFSPERFMVLRLRRNGYLLELVFDLQAEDDGPPAFAEIGGFRQSVYKKEPLVPVAVFIDGAISEPPH